MFVAITISQKRLIQPTSKVFIVEDMKGNFQVFGNDKCTTKASVAHDLGQDTTLTTIKPRGYQRSGRPYMSTEDGDIDCSNGVVKV